MKFLAALAVLAGVALAEPQITQAACPTVTKESLPRDCSRRCANSDCMYVSTVQNPCGCPDDVPTASLIHPCGADCPNNGCAVSIRVQDQPCPVSTRTRTSEPTRPPTVITGITQLPPKTTPCPTVTRTTTPADCPAVGRCPIPNCEFQDIVRLPCGCTAPKTALFVTGCPTGCPEGCLTRTRTSTEACATSSRDWDKA